jgi:hypothetical protein
MSPQLLKQSGDIDSPHDGGYLMKWNYVKDQRRLNVFGTDCDRDILTIKKLVEEAKIPKDLECIVYRENTESKFAAFFRGQELAVLLLPDPIEVAPNMVRPKIRTILKKINENNSLQSDFSGVTFYSTSTKRFMLATPRGRHHSTMLLGDHPISDAETPVEVVSRVTNEDTAFEIQHKWLVPLTEIEVENTKYHSFMILVEREFKPQLSPRLLNTVWATRDGLEGIHVHPSVKMLFETDPIIQKLTSEEPDIDFDALIEEILDMRRPEDVV